MFCIGGGERDRTDDLLLAKQALSQLSYTPQINWWARVDLNYRPHAYQACALTKLSYRPGSTKPDLPHHKITKHDPANRLALERDTKTAAHLGAMVFLKDSCLVNMQSRFSKHILERR